MALPADNTGGKMPFPYVSSDTLAEYGKGPAFLRPFGLLKDDLEIDFHARPRIHLITEILKSCTSDKNGRRLHEGFFEELSVGKRIEGLATIVTAGGMKGLSVCLRCSNQDCLESMEVEFSLDELRGLQRRSDEANPFTIQIEDKILVLRRPTCRDQLSWLERSFPHEHVATMTMIQDLQAPDEKGNKPLIPDEWIAIIDEAMTETDPLVNFRVTASCPHCGQDDTYWVDLEELLVQELQKEQTELIHTVHRLAFGYHWSEEEVFSIPPWRRKLYLSLLDKEEGLL